MDRRLLLAALAALPALACQRGPARPVTAGEVRAVRVEKLPDSPDDPAWAAAPVHPASLLPQDVVDPRVLAPTTAALEAQALTDGQRIAFRLAWAVPQKNDRVLPASFSDACAVQLPAVTSADAPSPMMGEAGKPVEITYWRAAWQATVDGRPDAVSAYYPNVKVDHYPFESASLPAGSPEQQAAALRYAPARAVGNTMAGPRTSPVEDLVAEGAGTLRVAMPTSSGSGKATATGYAVEIVRPLPRGIAPGSRTQVAFAVWQGARGEVGARKMRTGWIPLAVEGAK